MESFMADFRISDANFTTEIFELIGLSIFQKKCESGITSNLSGRVLSSSLFS